MMRLPQRGMCAGRPSGFTLAELIIAIALISVVTGLGTVTYMRIISYYGQAQSESRADKLAQIALDSVRDDLASLLSPSLANSPVVGGPQEGGGGSTLVVPVALPTFTDSRTAAAWVRYQVTRDDSGPRLVRTAVSLHQEIPVEGGTTVASGIQQFRVQFVDAQGQWVDEWNDIVPPAAVRVSVTAKDLDRGAGATVSRSAIVPVRVR